MRAIPLALGVAGVLLSWAGGAWDVAWHRTIGRDTFWSAPHLLLYGGVAVSGLAALVATAQATLAGGAPGRELRVGPLRVDLGLGLVGLGALGVILTAPLDDLWHRTFGPDVDIWSVPHVLAVAFAAWMYVGCALALERGAFPLPERVRLALRAIAISALCGLLVFGLNFYYFAERTREALFYPIAVGATVPFALALAAALLPWRWSVTLVAALYTLGAFETKLVLESLEWVAPSAAPLILAGAVAIDLVRARTRHPLALGTAFAVAFVAAEALRMLQLPVAPPPSAPPGLDPRGPALYLQYLGAAAARPWSSLWPVVGAIAAAPAAVFSWTLGSWIARGLGGPVVVRLRSSASPSPRAVTS